MYLKATVKISLIVLIAVFVVSSIGFLLPGLSQTTIAQSTNGTIIKGNSQASITVTLIDETEDYDTLLIESGRLANRKVYKSNVFTEGNLPLAISYSGSMTPSTETLDVQKIQELVKNNIRTYAGDLSRLKSVEFEALTNVTFTRQVETGIAYTEGYNRTGLNLTEYDNSTLLIANATNQTLKPKIETFRFFIDAVNGWYTDNVSQSTFAEVEDWRYEWRELKSLPSLELSNNNKFFINVKGRIIPSEEPFAVDVYPTVKIGTAQFDFPEFAWWNDTTCKIRYPILSNATKNIAISVNDTGLIKNDTIWTQNVSEPLYAYFENSGSFCGIANETLEKNWQNESSTVNNNSVVFNTSGTPAVWHFGEGTGTTAIDSTENAHDGTLVSSPAVIKGIYGNALDFTPNQDCISVSDDSFLTGMGQLTLQAWVRLDAINANQKRIFDHGNNDYLLFDVGNGDIRLMINDAVGPTATSLLDAGGWTLITATWDAGSAIIYANDSQVASGSVSSGTVTDNGGLVISHYDPACPNEAGGAWDGALDELRIYNRTLSSDEIRQMYWNGIDNLTALGSQESNSTSKVNGVSEIESGIKISLGNDAVIYTNQQIYARYLNGSQKLGRFDKVTEHGNQVWAFNYFNDSTPFTGMQNITPAFYVLEMANITSGDITNKVSNFISQTKT